MNIRNILRKSLLDILSPLAVPKNGIHILNGHFLSKNSACDSSVFIKQLKLLRNNYEFINVDTATELIYENSESLKTTRALAFSFDDGFSDCYHAIAPALDSYNVNAAFFINPNFVDGSNEYYLDFIKNRVNTPNKIPMTWDQIKYLSSNGFVIGNHTLDHKRLSELDDKEFFRQVGESKFILEEKLNKYCDYFAWPYGQQKDITDFQVDEVSKIHKYIFSGCDYTKYKSRGRLVINRRHFEPFWPSRHLNFFLSREKN